MKILVTGSNGFLGKNLIARLNKDDQNDIVVFTHENTITDLEQLCANCDFVFHFAAVQRPDNTEDYMSINYILTEAIIKSLEKNNNGCPIMFSSSIQAETDNPYGISKRAEEELFLKHKEAFDRIVYIYRFPNLFGKGAKPNYTSVVATFCYNIWRCAPITINNPTAIINFTYIEDVLDSLVGLLKKQLITENNYIEIEPVYQVTLGWLAYMIGNFKDNPYSNKKINWNDECTNKLYQTYLTYSTKSIR